MTDITAINSQIDLATLQSQRIDQKLNHNGNKTEIRETAESFESMVLSQMIGDMFTGLDPNGPFGGGKGEEVFKTLMIDEYGKSIVNSGGIGIADMVEKQLLHYQEQKNF